MIKLDLAIKERSDFMATSSIYNRININTKEKCVALANAIERAENAEIEPVIISRPVRELQSDEIKEFFKKIKL